MANDTPGSESASPGRGDETTFSPRPDQPPPVDLAGGSDRAAATSTRAPDRSPWAAQEPGRQDAGPDRAQHGDARAAGEQPGGAPQDGGQAGSAEYGGRPGDGRHGTGPHGGQYGADQYGGSPYGGGRYGGGPYGGGQYGGTDRSATPQYGGASGTGQHGGAGQQGGTGQHGTGQHTGTGQYGSAGQYGSGRQGTAAYAAGYGAPPSATGYAGVTGTGQHRAVGPSGPPTGQQPAVGAWGPPPPVRQRRGPGWGALVAVGIVAALLGGVLGAVGSTLAGGGGSGGSSGVLGAPVPDIDSASAPIGPVEAVAERVLPSVVQLRVEGQGAAGEGSGIVLSADGLILTNNHVVEAAAAGGSVTVVYQDGQTAPAQIVGLDPTSDLAVIRAQGRTDLTPAELGNSDAVRVGQQVVAFGSPLGLGGTVTTGIISAVDRAVSVSEQSGASEATVLNALQTDAAINPGNSGGPLTDMEGRIIGINSVIATTGQQGGSIGVGFAIPVNQARRIAEELEATGTATRAVLGVSLAPDSERSLAGAVVQSVTPGGAAEQAGIVAGDVIVRFGDQRVTNAIELQAAVRSHTPGEPVEVELEDRTVQVTPTAESG